MTVRPIYLGVGDCDCGVLDAKLYHVPGTALETRTVCARCLETRGYSVPTPRTAEDIAMVDGKPEWRPEIDTRPYPKEPELYVGQLELGHKHLFEVVMGSDDRLVGWLHTHPDTRDASALCQSMCAVRPIDDAPVYQVVCADPLTLTPSLLCRTCGSHGNVTNGKWEPL